MNANTGFKDVQERFWQINNLSEAEHLIAQMIEIQKTVIRDKKE